MILLFLLYAYGQVTLTTTALFILLGYNAMRLIWGIVKYQENKLERELYQMRMNMVENGVNDFIGDEEGLD